MRSSIFLPADGHDGYDDGRLHPAAASSSTFRWAATLGLSRRYQPSSTVYQPSFIQENPSLDEEQAEVALGKAPNVHSITRQVRACV